MRNLELIATVVLLSFLAGSTAAQDRIDADILLRGATIHDGTGGAATQGDVAIKGDRIVGVGTFPVGSVDLEIDCRGLIAAPGFIDLHNHSDSAIIDPKTRACVNYLMQGCTTIVTGNCGFGPIDVAEYYGKIDAAGAGTNVAHLIPQGRVRLEVLDTANRKADASEVKQMRALAEQAMRDGAWGMSTGLIYVPSCYADRDEITEVAKVVSANGGIYVSHIRGEGLELLESVHEALEIGRQAALPVHISHFKSSGSESWGLVRRAASMIETARQSGQHATADQYPYIASSTTLEATLVPTWAREGGQKELLTRLDDPKQSSRILDEITDGLSKRGNGSTIRIAAYANQPEWAGKSILEIATAEQVEPLALVLQITRNGGASIVSFCMSEDDVRHVMQLPWVATASDGRAYLPGSDKPHPRSYGTFTRKIGHYALRERAISLEQAIRSATGLPADIIRFQDRGYLMRGYFADVVVFDPNSIADEATYDMPHQYSRGISYVFVNGQPAVFNGHATGALAGRAIKHATGDNAK